MTNRNPPAHPHTTAFAGAWIGQTQGLDMPAHLWEIRPQGDYLRIATRWENDLRAATLVARLIPGQAAFQLGKFTATLVDPLHFVVPGWDTNDVRGHQGPAYDVVFSRAGLAELTSGRAYARFLAQQRAAPRAK
jgi:hypothetical protein